MCKFVYNRDLLTKFDTTIYIREVTIQNVIKGIRKITI